MNVRKGNSSLIVHFFYIVFVHYLWSFDVNLVNYAAKNSYKPTCLVITFNSRLHEMTLVEHYVGQSTNSLILYVAYA